MVLSIIILIGASHLVEFPREAENRILLNRMVSLATISIAGTQHRGYSQLGSVSVSADDSAEGYYRVASPNASMLADRQSGRPVNLSVSIDEDVMGNCSDEDLKSKAKAAVELFTGREVVLRNILQGNREKTMYYHVLDGGVRHEPILRVAIKEGSGYVRWVASYLGYLPQAPQVLRPSLEPSAVLSRAVLSLHTHHAIQELESRSAPELFISQLKGMAPSIEAFRSEAAPSELESARNGQGFLVYKTAFARPGSEFVEFLVSVNAHDGRAMLITDLRNAQGASGAKEEDSKPVIVPAATVFTRIATKKMSISLTQPLKEHKGKVAKRDFDAVFWSEKTAVVGSVDKNGFVQLNGKTYQVPSNLLKSLKAK